jgi:hypothetical protein
MTGGRRAVLERLEAAHQAGRDTEPDQGAADGERGEGMSGRKHQRAGHRHRQQRRHHAPRSEAIERQPHGQLGQREGQKIGAGEKAEIGRAHVQLAHQLGRDDRVDGAQEVRDVVGEAVGEQQRERRDRGHGAMITARTSSHRPAAENVCEARKDWGAWLILAEQE